MSSEVEPEVVKKAPTLSTSSSGQTNNVQRPWLTKNMVSNITQHNIASKASDTKHRNEKKTDET